MSASMTPLQAIDLALTFSAASDYEGASEAHDGLLAARAAFVGMEAAHAAEIERINAAGWAEIQKLSSALSAVNDLCTMWRERCQAMEASMNPQWSGCAFRKSTDLNGTPEGGGK